MANVVTYLWPTAGATAPTAAVMLHHQQVLAQVQGDAAATSFTVTHNMGISTAQLAAGFPEVELEVITAGGITAAPIISSKTANTVVFANTAFPAGAGPALNVRVKRPYSPTE